jgi:UDP-N-acetyl-D-mannosaminuronate dehydrogenase
VTLIGYDPLLELDDIESEFGIKAIAELEQAPKLDCVILAVSHGAFQEIALDKLRGIMRADPVLIDVRGIFSSQLAEEAGFTYRTL